MMKTKKRKASKVEKIMDCKDFYIAVAGEDLYFLSSKTYFEGNDFDEPEMNVEIGTPLKHIKAFHKPDPWANLLLKTDLKALKKSY